jgi:chromosome segregation ATPase
MLAFALVLGQVAAHGQGEKAAARAHGADSPLVYKAWNFVRGVSSELGVQTEDVLNVQQAVDAMARNLTFEQNTWDSRREALLAARSALEAEIARNAEAERAVANATEEANILLAELQQKQVALTALKQEVAQEEAKRQNTANTYEFKIRNLTAHLNAQQLRVRQVQQQQFNSLRTQKQFIADLESQVYAKTELLRATKGQAATKAAGRAESQSALLQQSIDSQKRNAHVEAELLKLTSEAIEVQKKKREYAHLLQEYKSTAAAVVDVRQHCEVEKNKLLKQVRLTKTHQDEQKGLIQRCQGEEAACQVLQRNLSACHPGLSITIPQ